MFASARGRKGYRLAEGPTETERERGDSAARECDPQGGRGRVEKEGMDGATCVAIGRTLPADRASPRVCKMRLGRFPEPNDIPYRRVV